MFHDKKNNRLFATNEVGVVSVYSIAQFPPTLLASVQTSDKASIRGLHIDFKKLFIFTGSKNGKICILDLGLPGKERFIKEISSFEGNTLIRIIKYHGKRNELITADSGGKIIIWSIKNGTSICKTILLFLI